MTMEKYRHLNIKLTPQRIAILSYLNGNKTHPSAEDIYKAVQKQFPTMSFATVYNTMEALKHKGNIRELKIDSNKKRYDPDSTKHHHLICLKCKNIVDIHKDFKLDLSEEMTKDFNILGNSIEFYGVCRKCKKRQ
ncbi:MAG: transcriptional repressor [Thermodesulfovibrionia bacterium]|nr:transcriptional repressor [Thermodesulfovibrionia bacterium]